MEMEQKNKEDYSKGLLLSEKMYQYTLETFVHPREHELLKELRDITASHPYARMGTAPDAGQMISMLLNMTNAKRTIEIGVFTGYSLLLTALTIPVDGKIVAIDLNRDTYEIGLPIIQKAGVEHKIEFVQSDALSALDKLLESHENEGNFDYAFVDADKVNYLKYHERLLKLLKVDGLAVYDNTLWGGTVILPATEVPEFMAPGRQWTIELNNSLATDSRVQLLHAPLGDGITICRKTGSQLTMENSMKKSSYLKGGLLQSEELYQYILETSVFPREAEVLKELRVITQDHPRPNLGTSPDAGQLIAMLLKLIDAKKTIEIGVFTGYSLLVTALSIPDDGKIMAIDINQESYAMGLPIIKKARVEHKINFVESQALSILDKLLEDHDNEESFDFVYVDADKNNYFEYHERLLKLVKVGGIIVYDNTLCRGRILVPEDSIPEQFRERRKWTLLHNKFLASDQRIQICHIPVGDGSIICRRVKG